MSLQQIIKGDYGQTLELTFIDVDTSSAADISGYSDTIEMIFTKPDGTEVTKTATFKSDGSDGVIEYTVEDGLLDTAGGWRVRGRVQNGDPATAVLTTEKDSFTVYS